MENLFPEYFINKTQNIKKILENSYIIFDTNVLLNLYEYSDTTANEYLNIMEEFTDRIWSPSWIIYEFLENRERVIQKEIAKYSKLIDSISELSAQIKEDKYQPIIDKEIINNYKNNVKDLENHITEKQKNYKESNSLDKDKKIDRLNKLFLNSIGEKYTEDQLKKIITEGKPRLDKKQPPGYTDYKEKAKASESPLILVQCKQYGDLIIWKQILAYAKKNTCNIYFVTDEKKLDWYDNNGYVKKELFKEFYEYTDGQNIIINRSSKFIEQFKNLNTFDNDYNKISNKSITEIKELEKINFNKMRLSSDFDSTIFNDNFQFKHNNLINSNIIPKETIDDLYFLSINNSELLSEKLSKELKNLIINKSKYFSIESLQEIIKIIKENKSFKNQRIYKELPNIIEEYNKHYEKILSDRYSLTNREIQHGEEEVLFYCPNCGHLSYVNNYEFDECLICGYTNPFKECVRCGNKLSNEEMEIAEEYNGLCSYCANIYDKFMNED